MILTMKNARQLAVFAALAALAVLARPGALLARRRPTEAELKARLEGERNPVKKAKLEIDLGGLKLSQAASAFDHNDPDSGAKLLDAYYACMQQAWTLLEASGRNPSRRPQGFTDLDIALREHGRQLYELQQRTPFEDAAPIARVAKQADSLHTQVMAALFPGGKLEPAPADAKPKGAPRSALRPPEPPR